MSLSISLAQYIEAKTSLTVDTDLFVSDEPDTSPDRCAVVTPSPGSLKNQSGLEMMAVQIIAKDISFVRAETLAYTIFNLLENKPGFNSISNTFYCDVINAPFPLDVDSRGRYVYSMNFIISKITV